MVPPDPDGRSGGSRMLLFELVASGSGDDGCSRGKGRDGCCGRLDGAPRKLALPASSRAVVVKVPETRCGAARV